MIPQNVLDLLAAAEADPSTRPMLADALEDAGYADDWWIPRLRACKATAADWRREGMEQWERRLREAKAVAETVAAHPRLLPAADRPTWSSYRVAAHNIRSELARVFPGTVFKVTCDSYSMGNSVSITWTDGPTSKQVDDLAKPYQYGYFDGSTDSYNYTTSDFNRAFGSAKYVSASRTGSDAGYAEAFRREYPNGLSVDGVAITADTVMRHVRGPSSYHVQRSAERPFWETDLSGWTAPAGPSTDGLTVSYHKLHPGARGAAGRYVFTLVASAAGRVWSTSCRLGVGDAKKRAAEWFAENPSGNLLESKYIRQQFPGLAESPAPAPSPAPTADPEPVALVAPPEPPAIQPAAEPAPVRPSGPAVMIAAAGLELCGTAVMVSAAVLI